MKIVYCIKTMAIVGGIERILATKATWLAEHGYEVLFVTTDQGEQSLFFELPRSIRHIELGINYQSTYRLSRLKKYKAVYRLKKEHRKCLTELLQKERPDFVISVGHDEASFLPKIQDGSIKIFWIHGAKEGKRQRWLYPQGIVGDFMANFALYTVRRVARQFDQVVSLTPDEKDYWHSVVIPNMPVFENKSNTPPVCLKKLNKKRAIAVGRFSMEKNFSEMIDIWAMVAPQFPDWTLDLYGGGSLKDSLWQQVDRLGLLSSVALHNAHKDIGQEYLLSSVMLLTSLTEGFPMVLLEAQRFGIPVVSYDSPCGPRNIISDGEDGYLVPMHDKKLFAERLITLMRDENLSQQMGAKARENVQRFHPDVIMKKWLQLFQTLKENRQ